MRKDISNLAHHPVRQVRTSSYWDITFPILCLLALLLCSCTAPLTRAYSGPEQPPDRIALLKHQTGFLKPSVYFVSIDGVPLSERKHHFGDAELLPGSHEVEFGFESAFGFSTQNARVVFEAEANHQYEAIALVLGYSWRGIIIDLGTRKSWQLPATLAMRSVF